MKLYTEEQVRKAIDMARKPELFGTRDIKFMYSDEHIILLLTPIELPSDEEIEKNADKYSMQRNDRYFEDFVAGAKWMKEQIQKQIQKQLLSEIMQEDEKDGLYENEGGIK